MNKKIIVISITSALLFGANVAQAEVAQIVSINGKAFIERANHKYHAQYGMVLEEGDIVRSLQGKVKLKYANCVSVVDTAYEVKISKASPCATAKRAKASDLVAPAVKKYKIQRIDNNLAEAECSACKVDLAKRGAAGFTASPEVMRAVGGAALLALLAKNGSGSDGNNDPTGSGSDGNNDPTGSGSDGNNDPAGSGSDGNNDPTGSGSDGNNDPTGGGSGGSDNGGGFGGNSDIPVSPL